MASALVIPRRRCLLSKRIRFTPFPGPVSLVRERSIGELKVPFEL